MALFLYWIWLLWGGILALPDEGKWDDTLTVKHNDIVLLKSLNRDAQIFIQVNCESPQHDVDIQMNILIVPSICWDVTSTYDQAKEIMQQKSVPKDIPFRNAIWFNTNQHKCGDHIKLDNPEVEKSVESLVSNTHPVYVCPMDGIYFLIMIVQLVGNTTIDYHVGVHIEMRSDYGYLSAVDWPLLPFYGCMCGFYVVLGVVWLILSFLQWRDLLRVQFWIGAVILLGMLEKATFYSEYQSVNTTGQRIQGVMLFAQWISCGKRTLARMLVIIVSLGFGVVKPRLGATLHHVVGVGVLYFILAASEAYLAIMKPKNDATNTTRDLLVASVPLAFLDSGICWWIFSALVNTTRTLRLRRNEIKLQLYRHFTNTLIFAVLASICFRLYSIKIHWMDCFTAWKDLWLEEAYWHILFSVLLVVIMCLWRPTNNNQRYAFVPLLDTADLICDDNSEEEERFVNTDAYGVIIRNQQQQQSRNNEEKRNSNSLDEQIKWLEENIKSEPALPVVDLDEELITTRFEISKMQ